MSEQNSMAISPVTAGLTGAVVGGAGNYFLGVGAKTKEGYRDAKELLTLKEDEFRSLKEKVEKDGDEAAKTEFKKLEDGRTTVSSAGDELVKQQADAKIARTTAIEEAVSNGVIDVKADAEKTAMTENETKLNNLRTDINDSAEIKAKRAELVQARKDAREAIINKKDEGLGKELAEATDDAKKAEINKKISEAVTKDEKVVAAKKALNDERAKILTDDAKKVVSERNAKKAAYADKLAENLEGTEAYKNATAKKDGTALEKLKALVEDKKAILDKKVDEVKATKAGELVGENGSLKNLEVDKFKKFLPKAKMMPALIGAAVLGAAGVALAYIVGPKNETPADVA